MYTRQHETRIASRKSTRAEEGPMIRHIALAFLIFLCERRGRPGRGRLTTPISATWTPMETTPWSRRSSRPTSRTTPERPSTSSTPTSPAASTTTNGTPLQGGSRLRPHGRQRAYGGHGAQGRRGAYEDHQALTDRHQSANPSPQPNGPCRQHRPQGPVCFARAPRITAGIHPNWMRPDDGGKKTKEKESHNEGELSGEYAAPKRERAWIVHPSPSFSWSGRLDSNQRPSVPKT